jgi:hypothetical protein
LPGISSLEVSEIGIAMQLSFCRSKRRRNGELCVIYDSQPPRRTDLERIIGNLDKAKLKLDEAFFYLDEIEELIQEDELNETAGSKVSQAAERLTSELSALSSRVAELQDILRALEEQRGASSAD